MRINKALNLFIDFRLKTKLLFFPFEKWLLALADKLK